MTDGEWAEEEEGAMDADGGEDGGGELEGELVAELDEFAEDVAAVPVEGRVPADLGQAVDEHDQEVGDDHLQHPQD